MNVVQRITLVAVAAWVVGVAVTTPKKCMARTSYGPSPCAIRPQLLRPDHDRMLVRAGIGILVGGLLFGAASGLSKPVEGQGRPATRQGATAPEGGAEPQPHAAERPPAERFLRLHVSRGLRVALTVGLLALWTIPLEWDTAFVAALGVGLGVTTRVVEGQVILRAIGLGVGAVLMLGVVALLARGPVMGADVVALAAAAGTTLRVGLVLVLAAALGRDLSRAAFSSGAVAQGTDPQNQQTLRSDQALSEHSRAPWFVWAGLGLAVAGVLIAAHLTRYSAPSCVWEARRAGVQCYVTDRWTGRIRPNRPGRERRRANQPVYRPELWVPSTGSTAPPTADSSRLLLLQHTLDSLCRADSACATRRGLRQTNRPPRRSATDSSH